MESKDQNPIALLNKQNVTPLIEICYTLSYLKSLYRQGWLQKGITPIKCESVADHIFGVISLTMIFADYYHIDLDMIKLFRMAVIHDVSEIFSGDITPYDHISKDEKYNLEKASIVRLFKSIHLEIEYLKIWEEFERGVSREAQFIQQIDKLEMIVQASIYENQESIDLGEFFRSTRESFSNSKIIEIFAELENLRNEG